MTARTPILIDCDTGIDDSLALFYAAASADAEIMAVTCCTGNVEADQVAANTLAILELAGRTDIEVALGRKVPLVRSVEVTPETHGPTGSRLRRPGAAEPTAQRAPRCGRDRRPRPPPAR